MPESRESVTSRPVRIAIQARKKQGKVHWFGVNENATPDPDCFIGESAAARSLCGRIYAITAGDGYRRLTHTERREMDDDDVCRWCE